MCAQVPVWRRYAQSPQSAGGPWRRARVAAGRGTDAVSVDVRLPDQQLFRFSWKWRRNLMPAGTGMPDSLSIAKTDYGRVTRQPEIGLEAIKLTGNAQTADVANA